MYRVVFFLTGLSKIFLRVRLHSKSHQKSSKCQNLPTGWHLLGPVKKCTLYISILGPKISDEVQILLHRKWVHYHMVQTVSRLDYVYKVPRNEHSNTAPLRIRSLIIQRFIFIRMRQGSHPIRKVQFFWQHKQRHRKDV